MELKTVNGLGRRYYVQRAFDTAMDKAFNPTFVDAWAKWFDESQADQPEAVLGVVRPFEDGDLDAAPPPQEACDQCVKLHGDPDSMGMCRICPNYNVVASRPEYYLADLEEVAANQTIRIERALRKIASIYGNPERPPEWLDGLFAELQGELKTPGYVEGLIPQ